MNAKIQIKTTSTTGSDINESMVINPEIAQNVFSDDSDTAIAAATLLDTFARGVIGCTTSDYQDTIVTLVKQTHDHADD